MARNLSVFHSLTNTHINKHTEDWAFIFGLSNNIKLYKNV